MIRCWRVIGLALLCACAVPPRSFTISAAANLQPAFSEIGAAFERQTGVRVIFNFGATGALAQQIAQGAPVDLFAAADRATIDDLVVRDWVLADSVQVYARGQIVLYTRGEFLPSSLDDLARPEIKRIAIANPERAPYGAAAREALKKANLWETLQSKIILAENIQQTQQYADTGNVEVAIVARSLVVNALGRWAPIPENLYQPIDQALGVVKRTKNESDARAFAKFVASPAARNVLEKYGYQFP